MEGTRLGSIARGLALFLGLFSLLNILGELRTPGFDANLWWIDFSPLSRVAGRTVLAVASLALLGHALARGAVRPRWLRVACTALILGLAAVAISNAVTYYRHLNRGDYEGIWLPFSAIVAAALLIVGWSSWRGPLPLRRQRRLAWTMGTFVACLLAFPLGQMFCFGKTDYRRPADFIVVLGARVYADGRPSEALADRVATACELYRGGYARKVIMSGGPGDGSIHETDAMRDLAIKLGVAPGDIIQDRDGVNTAATVHNTLAIVESAGGSRVLVVSHFYHLPRIKMSYMREGWNVYTVPVRAPLRKTALYALREVAALWLYYLRPLIPNL